MSLLNWTYHILNWCCGILKCSFIFLNCSRYILKCFWLILNSLGHNLNWYWQNLNCSRHNLNCSWHLLNRTCKVLNRSEKGVVVTYTVLSTQFAWIVNTWGWLWFSSLYTSLVAPFSGWLQSRDNVGTSYPFLEAISRKLLDRFCSNFDKRSI